VSLDTTRRAATPGTVPAFPGRQPSFLKMTRPKGVKDLTYHAALEHIYKQTRENGIGSRTLT